MQASYQKSNFNMSILKWAKQSYCYTKKDIQNAGTRIMGREKTHIFTQALEDAEKFLSLAPV